MQRPRPWQGPLSSIRELLGRRGTNAVEIRGTGRAKCGTHTLEHDLSGGRKAHDRQMSFVVEIYIDPPQLFCNFCRSVGHDERTCQSYELMMDRIVAYLMQTKTRALYLVTGMACGGFQGQGQGWGGMGLGRGRGKVICYNCGGPGHYTHDCTNPMRIYCSYYEQFDHEMVYFPTLITQMHKKGVLQPTST